MKPRIEIGFDKEVRKAFVRKEPLYFPRDNEFLLNHARSGLLLALQSLQLPQGSQVGLMVYNCHTVMNAVAQAGYEAAFVDIDDGLRMDLDDLQRKSESMKALVVTHLFGIVNDVKAIRERCPHLIIVEDCAHAFGKPIEGDFGVYSIGQGKLPSLGDGGILMVNNAKYVDAVKSRYAALSSYSAWSEMELFAKLLLRRWMYGRLLYGSLTMRWKQSRKPVSAKDTIVMKRMSLGVRAMYGLRKDAVNFQIARRKENAMKESELLSHNSLASKVLCGENAFMLVVVSTNPSSLRSCYAERGVETATHFSNTITWAKEFGYRGDCPKAEKMMETLLMVPVY